MQRWGALLLLVAALAAAAPLTAAQGTDGRPNPALIRRRDLLQTTPPRLVRRELNTFMNSPSSFFRSLFIQALSSMMNSPPTNRESYFQLAGIHGMPYVSYDGAVNPRDPYRAGQNRNGGYCPHFNTLFPTWHRAEMLSFETALRNRAFAIARAINRTVSVNEGRAWLKAADEMAMPYWNWASTSVRSLPSFFTAGSLSIRATNGAYRTVGNPLRSYTIPSSATFTPRRSCSDQPEGCRSTLQATSAINRGLPGFVQQARFGIGLALSSSTWGCVSNNGASNNCGGQGSIESVHDSFHVLMGGWMGDTTLASFAPIFWFHHCFVDRLIAQWQVRNPRTWVSAQIDREGGTYWWSPGTRVDALTLLAPFRKPNGAFYNSNEVRNWTRLGYEYDRMDNAFTTGTAAASAAAAAAAAAAGVDPSYYRYYLALPAVDRTQPISEIRVFVSSPGANAQTPTFGNPNYVGSMSWLKHAAHAHTGGPKPTRVQLDLTDTIARLGRTKPVALEAANPANPAAGPALDKAPVRLQDIQLVAVGADGNLLASAQLGPVLLNSAWVNPADNLFVTAQLQAA